MIISLAICLDLNVFMPELTKTVLNHCRGFIASLLNSWSRYSTALVNLII